MFTRVPALAALTVALSLALGQVDGQVRSLQGEHAPAAGLQTFAFGIPGAALFERAKLVVDFWNDSTRADFTELCVVVYTLLDVAFIVAYIALFAAVLKRLRNGPEQAEALGWLGQRARRPFWPLAALAAADVIEDILLALVATGTLPASWGWVAACLAATVAKWLLVAHAVGMVVALLREQSAWLRRVLGELRHAVWRLRVPALLSGAFGLLMLADPTGQGPDLLRRWMDGRTWIWAIVATLLFCAALWAAARRIVLGDDVGPGEGARPGRGLAFAAAGIALIAAGVIGGLPRLTGVGIVALGVFVAGELWRRLFGRAAVDLETQRVARAAAERRASAGFPIATTCSCASGAS